MKSLNAWLLRFRVDARSVLMGPLQPWGHVGWHPWRGSGGLGEVGTVPSNDLVKDTEHPSF